MPVTTRIVPFLVGNPNLNLHLPLLLGGRTQVISRVNLQGTVRPYPTKVVPAGKSSTQVAAGPNGRGWLLVPRDISYNFLAPLIEKSGNLDPFMVFLFHAKKINYPGSPFVD